MRYNFNINLDATRHHQNKLIVLKIGSRSLNKLIVPTVPDYGIVFITYGKDIGYSRP